MLLSLVASLWCTSAVSEPEHDTGFALVRASASAEQPGRLTVVTGAGRPPTRHESYIVRRKWVVGRCFRHTAKMLGPARFATSSVWPSSEDFNGEGVHRPRGTTANPAPPQRCLFPAVPLGNPVPMKRSHLSSATPESQSPTSWRIWQPEPI